MNPYGKIICCGLTFDDMVIPFFPFMLKQASIHAALTSTPEQLDEMLAFAAKKGVRPMVEVFPMSEAGAAQAIEKLTTGRMRYRGVLEV
jgi:D-arabinose 1-dehydrogenase-like Zn-dependent alcohol dehydrogenase